MACRVEPRHFTFCLACITLSLSLTSVELRHRHDALQSNRSDPTAPAINIIPGPTQQARASEREWRAEDMSPEDKASTIRQTNKKETKRDKKREREKVTERVRAKERDGAHTRKRERESARAHAREKKQGSKREREIRQMKEKQGK